MRIVPLGCALVGEWEKNRKHESFTMEIVEIRMME